MVSVIVPAYNAESTIRTTLEAILKQSYKNIEVLVVDDGSKDSTAEIVSVYEDCRIVLIRKENGGVSSARNFGIKKARGEWIALHYITAFTKNILIVYEKIKYFRRVFICVLRKNR